MPQITNKPLQRLSYSDKVRDNKQWFKDNMDYGIKSANFSSTGTANSGTASEYTNYRVYNNEIPLEWFNYVTNPLNTQVERYKKFPARIRPCNIIKPSVDLYIGEYLKRPSKYTVINTSDEAANSYLEGLREAMYSSVRQRYIMELVSAGQIDPEEVGNMSLDDIPLPQEVEKEYKKSYVDSIADKAFGALNHASNELNFDKIFLDLLKDYAVDGKCFSYKGIHPDSKDLIYERVNTGDIIMDKSPDKSYGEDGTYAIRRKLIDLADLIDLHYDSLDPEVIEGIDALTSSGTTGSSSSLYSGLNTLASDGKFYLYHYTWKSLEKIGILSYFDEFGQVQSMEVDESYSPDKDLGESVEWIWRTAWFEGRYIEIDSLISSKVRSNEGKSLDLYFDLRRVAIQRNDLNHTSANKCPYNSVYYSNTNSNPISLVSVGIPHLMVATILDYRIELTIAKSKGKITFFNKTLIADNEDEDEEKFMYYAEAMGWGFFDPSVTGAKMGGVTPVHSADMSLFKDIKELINIKESIKQDYDDLLGITRQRKGEITSSDSVGGAQLASLNSSTISEYFFKTFEDFKETELQGLLDHVKYAYSTGKKSLYFNSEKRQQILELDEGDFAYSELGIHISTDPKELQKVEQFKANSQAFAQNGSRPETLAEILESDTMSDILSVLENAKEVEMRIAEKQARSEGESAQELEATKNEIAKDFESFKSNLVTSEMEAKADREDNREYIKGEVALSVENVKEGAYQDPSNVIDSIEKNNLEREKSDESNRANKKQEELKEKELSIKEKDVEAKRYNTDVNLKIAKENRNKYDSKK